MLQTRPDGSQGSPSATQGSLGRVTLALVILTAACASGLLATQVDVPAAQIQRESIPGTLVTFELVQVPAGTIMMAGAPVSIEAFRIGRTEVTWDMYDVFALGLDERNQGGAVDAIARPSEPYGAPDHGWGHAGYPAISITKAGADAFCAWLSAVTGHTYRLPTEAEWEYVAGLAIAGRASGWKDALAWHAGNSSGRTHRVGSKGADSLGLFDLFGNAAEWVTSGDGSLVVRGGSFRDAPEAIGPDARAVQDSSWNERDPQLPKSGWWLSDAPFAGFRIVRITEGTEVPEKSSHNGATEVTEDERRDQW